VADRLIGKLEQHSHPMCKYVHPAQRETDGQNIHIHILCINMDRTSGTNTKLNMDRTSGTNTKFIKILLRGNISE
jgi:hypothetical protein